MADDRCSSMRASIDDFFARNGLTRQDKLDCFSLVRQLYPGYSIVPAPYQGYCSLSVLVGDDKVIQFRPHCYRLDIRVTDAARAVYGTFAPGTKYITTMSTSGLLVYAMDRIRGISLKEFREGTAGPSSSFEHLARLCMDFATFLSKSWIRDERSHVELGIVGKSIISRLATLCMNLPLRFRPTARRVLKNISQIQVLPWVLTHGDIVPGNLMVDSFSGHLLGLVDWAEAEYLPFGVNFYGLEEILGQMTPSGFQYHANADVLRGLFWGQLRKGIPELQNASVLEAVELARDLGVLLWHGIAFDNGAIDRVVEEEKDVNEICRLDAFLDLRKQKLISRKSKI
ncbi:hypothetical protein B0O99DRAFT_599441 [Bisporella sp. PMI_857]|nr:hypothetical protein B0O99DRAFT_599441 [Bisporella sp. PMI_857]